MKRLSDAYSEGTSSSMFEVSRKIRNLGLEISEDDGPTKGGNVGSTGGTKRPMLPDKAKEGKSASGGPTIETPGRKSPADMLKPPSVFK